MKERIPHCCISVDRPCAPRIIRVIKHSTIIECRTVGNIITSPIDTKVFDIDLRERYIGIKQKVGREEKLLIERPSISRSIKYLRISCISNYGLRREEVCIELHLHRVYVVGQTELLPAERVLIILI